MLRRVFMLQRKPRKNDLIEYIFNACEYFNGAEPEWGLLGTAIRCDGNICYIRKPDGETTSFIWNFPSDGERNKLTRIR